MSLMQVDLIKPRVQLSQTSASSVGKQLHSHAPKQEPQPCDQVTLSASAPAHPTSGAAPSTLQAHSHHADHSAACATAPVVGGAVGAAVAQAVFEGLKTGFVQGYMDPQATLQFCRELEQKYPNLVELVELPIRSHGYDGKNADIKGSAPLYYMRLGPRDSDRDSKLGVYQHASPHAREHVNPLTMVELAEQLCANYDPASEDPAVKANTRLLEKLDIYISPQTNPDGANYSFYDDKRWRKNRAPHDGVDTGVDINRNYPYKWEKSRAADYQTYAGQGPASEPETRAIISVVDQHPNIRFVADWHSHSEEVRRPKGVSAKDKPFYDEFHGRVSDAIAGSRGRRYGVVESQVVEGSSDDFWYHERGLYSTILETARSFQPEQPEALQVMAECARGAREILEVAADYAEQRGLAKAQPDASPAA